jgi:dephospho-CoA kinase
MMVIGLTGSIAMGKSEVAKVLAEEGLPVFDADHEVHRFYDSVQGAQLLRPLFPFAVTAGKVDRQKLSAHLMAKPDDLTKLEKRVHAEIARRRADFLSRAKSEGEALAVLDVPLLFETGLDQQVDVTVVVSSHEHLQRRRALARPGMTEAKLSMVLKRQMPDAEKRQRANYVIENNESLEVLREKVLSVLHDIKEKAGL